MDTKNNPNLITTYPAVAVKDVRISLRSRVLTRLLKWTLRPMMSWFVRGSKKRMAKGHLFVAKTQCKHTAGLAQNFRIVNRVPGPTVGEFDNTDGRVLLWLHGGGFIIPAAPMAHLRLVALLSKVLNSSGFLPDYRLAPLHKFPAALDDCERAYMGLLEAGYDPCRIMIAGESAGGNLTLGTLLRLRKAGAPLPALATLISPVTEMGRLHMPLSRTRNKRRDPMIPVGGMVSMGDAYTGDWDASDPELSPLYADFSGLPPMHYITGETEVLRDDSVLCAQRAKDAGVTTQLDVWPVLPHAFALFEALFPETAIVRRDITHFAQQHLT